MALSVSVDQVDETGREILTYGTADFPIAFFDDDLTRVAVPCHWHDELEIVIITEGVVRMRIAGTEFSLSAGEGYFANSGILHAAQLTTPAGHQHAMVFNPRLLSQSGDLIWNTYLAPVLDNPRIPFLRMSPTVPWQRDMLALAEMAWNQGAFEAKDYPLAVRSCPCRVFSRLTDHLSELEGVSSYSDRFQRDELRMKQMLVLIEKNYASCLTIEDIAACANVSTSTCLRLFRTVVNTTPIRYLLRCRLQKAAEKLKRMDGTTVSEIAHTCGFSDASYFNRCFRREYGMTPSDYKNECMTE